jgi:4-hydroxy-3-polyprenylbenzoate decarboxylase
MTKLLYYLYVEGDRDLRSTVGVTCASGVIYGIKILEELKKKDVEIRLIISKWGGFNIKEEKEDSLEAVRALASYYYEADDLAANISSGTFQSDGMIIAPCSMKTLSGITHGFTNNLLIRAADVAIKEGRKLVLLVRETPLSPIHLENMLKLARLGIVIMPPVPAFYVKHQSVKDIIQQTVGRVCDLFGLTGEDFQRWQHP